MSKQNGLEQLNTPRCEDGCQTRLAMVKQGFGEVACWIYREDCSIAGKRGDKTGAMMTLSRKNCATMKKVLGMG